VRCRLSVSKWLFILGPLLLRFSSTSGSLSEFAGIGSSVHVDVQPWFIHGSTRTIVNKPWYNRSWFSHAWFDYHGTTIVNLPRYKDLPWYHFVPWLTNHVLTYMVVRMLEPWYKHGEPWCSRIVVGSVIVQRLYNWWNREVTYHIGSHSVTCHPAEVTFPPLPQPKLVLDLAIPKGCKAELT